MTPTFDREFWTRAVDDLCRRLRAATRRALLATDRQGRHKSLARSVSMGAGDLTFGIDVPAESVCSEWLDELAKQTPLSLLTEEAGWRHRGPGGSNGDSVIELSDFAHGGPRIALDPIDGTRNLMVDLRSAWTIVALAAPGKTEPRLKDVELGIVSELPNTSMDRYRRISAWKGTGCRREVLALEGDLVFSDEVLLCDNDDRCDNGYFPFFRYERSQAQDLIRIECEFIRRLEQYEGADILSCYDDQYISNGGQLVLLSEGTYRFIADLRAWLAELRAKPATTSRPYDSAGAVLCAREAGAIVLAVNGSELDYPLDTSTPVSFVGFANHETRTRLLPHIQQALQVSAECG